VYPVLFHIGDLVVPAYGAAAAIGVVLALLLAQRTARLAGVNAAEVWNLSILALFAALMGSRLLLVGVNWRDVLHHPAWIFGLSMVHHPLVSAAGAACGALVAWLYARRRHMPLRDTADALAAPLALALAFEQLGALLAGSGYGVPSDARWAVTYTSILAERWSGTPLGVPLHPAQAYAAVAYLTIAVVVLLWLPMRRREGDAAGMWLLLTGVASFLTELWRDPEGRGALFGGLLDGPQAAAIAFVLAGGALLAERKTETAAPAANPAAQIDLSHEGDDA
jgi:phosphatidylglycerol:prolipoprotein diacylglycerol transferase